MKTSWGNKFEFSSTKGIYSLFFFFKFNYLINLFMAVLGLRFCVRAFSSCGKGGHSSSRCAGLSLSWPLLLRSTGSRRAGSVVVAHGPSCSAACGIFPDQGSNPSPLHWQADSQPLRHQGSPWNHFKLQKSYKNSSKSSLIPFELLTFLNHLRLSCRCDSAFTPSYFSVYFLKMRKLS